MAGLETLAGPQALGEIVRELGSQRTIFSLDLDEGRPRKGAQSAWKSDDAFELALEATEQGVRQILLLDVARVGTGRGPGTTDLTAQIRAVVPEVNVFVGGGISGIDEVFELRAAGASGVLVASAIHDGRIGRRELDCFAASGSGDSVG